MKDKLADESMNRSTHKSHIETFRINEWKVAFEN